MAGELENRLDNLLKLDKNSPEFENLFNELENDISDSLESTEKRLNNLQNSLISLKKIKGILNQLKGTDNEINFDIDNDFLKFKKIKNQKSKNLVGVITTEGNYFGKYIIFPNFPEDEFEAKLGYFQILSDRKSHIISDIPLEMYKAYEIEIHSKEGISKKYAIARKEGVYINNVDVEIKMPKNTKDFVLDKILYIGIDKIKLRKSKINDFVYEVSLQ